MQTRKIKFNFGMTYIELIIVLSIFALLSTVAVFNYGEFQDKVDIKNLASDVALRVVKAQKDSLSGALPGVSVPSNWKPSYGVYFKPTGTGADNKSFVYFVDISSPPNNVYDGDFDCPHFTECLEKVTITKGSVISALKVFYLADPDPETLEDLTVTFSRVNSGGKLVSGGAVLVGVDRIEIDFHSPRGSTGCLNLYPSGRVELTNCGA